MTSKHPVDATILIIEGRHAEFPAFAAALQKKGFDVEVVPSGSRALGELENLRPDLVVVNAASLRSSGVRICQSLRKADKNLPIILIVSPEKTPRKKTAANVVLTLPFTAQKLINRIAPLLPGDGKHILHVGPIRLDTERRRVRCLGKSARLTPRGVRLLSLLLARHGEVIERKELFQTVWETDYTGDARTLDVHIFWLRNAIEPNPKQPKFLKTIRGVGYRLDV
jgi:DNA-binding response OmpR family regulator